MSYIPETSNRDLWVTLGALAAALAAIGWWNRRDDVGRTAATENTLLEAESFGALEVQDEGWQH